jgi:transposase
MNPSPTVTKIKYVGLDVHAETIAVAIADSSGAVRAYGTVPAHSHSVDRLVKKLAEDGMEVRYVYEAGPTGFWLCRHLRGKGIPCEVIAPSLIPQKASDRVKTDRRDALNLARLFRSGELTSVRVPDEADEAIRDLVRTRLATVEDLRRCRQRIKGYMLRYGRRYDGKSSWNPRHLNYLSLQKFDYPAQQIAFEELLNAIKDPADRIERLDAAIETQVKSWKREPLVRALMCFRGLALLNATTLVCELGDLTRFDSPGPLMSFVGLVPTEDSSGKRRRQGGVTKSGNSAARRALVEAAWQYRLPARVTPHIRQRQHDQPKAVTDIAWKAQQRLCGRYRSLIKGGKKSVVAVTAVARELVGFIWAVAIHIEGAQSHLATPTAPGRAPRGEDRPAARLCSKSPDAADPATKRIYVLKPFKPTQARKASRKASP